MFLLQGANKVNCYSDQLKLGQVCKIRVELYNYTLGKDSKIKLIISGGGVLADRKVIMKLNLIDSDVEGK